MKKSILFSLIIISFLPVFSQTVTDYDGNVYNTVTIGTQVWMKQNLKVTHYNNGDAISNVTDNTAWSSLSSGAYCNFNNDVANVATYGRLYNFYALVDSRKICPTGWHAPEDWELTNLENNLGGATVAGGKMKEAGTTHWTSPNTGATNSSNFTFLPGGMRISSGTFGNFGSAGFLWTSTEQGSLNAWYRWLGTNAADSYKNSGSKGFGFSVRCISNTAAGVYENNIDFNINVYPNPAKNIVNIEIEKTDDYNISVYNILGSCVINQKLNNQKNTINVSSLENGIYLLQISNKSGVVSQQKIVKE
ncbi:MAG: T9SS type A sorting domain-containing protein [Bacteroidia bacterium]|nr:T9SS type A sorting domain-containing protein [Bacteroidia bacterium]